MVENKLVENPTNTMTTKEGELAYRMPTLLRDKLRDVLGKQAHFDKVMDLGCGTELSGAAFADISGRISGIDVYKNRVIPPWQLVWPSVCL